jgi:hypothetical protein
MLLSLIHRTSRIGRIEALHHPIELEIRRALKRIGDAERTEEEAYAEQVTEVDGELIEDLLGIAFAVSQNFLTSVRTPLLALARAYHQHFGVGLTLKGKVVKDSNGRARDIIFKCADELSPGVGFTRIEAINALANYWKHHEEWPRGWREGDESRLIVWNENQAGVIQKRTIEIVTALGMSLEGTWNLREAASRLGMKRPSELAPVRLAMSDWAGSLLREARAQVDLKTKK